MENTVTEESAETPQLSKDRPDSELAVTLRAMSSTAVVLGATLILLSIVHPNLIFRNNTPTGGDMGAHVWGPAFLRDVLLPQWQLTGWSMDWYAGLPTYRFYMVIPALAIVFFDVFSVNGDVKALRAGCAVAETALVLSAQESVASIFRTGFDELFDFCLFRTCCSGAKTRDTS